ncbi:unnamed protein product [Blepharisma stoltei]|uniref:C2H2-type domain-containing protein n=1 Tax=Blepharisma stoltei TaxID=1481888 RepID=A0AAU9JEU2_9CILI|nr:unnamed protein product [Blepharisma stoltei]
MDLNFILENDTQQLARLEELGYDLDSLFIVVKDIFSIFDEIGLGSKDTAEILMRLKNIHDIATHGKPLPPNIVMYENSKQAPTRLGLTNEGNGKTILFKLVQGQNRLEKNNMLYKCEECDDDNQMRRVDTRRHVEEVHNNLL